MSDSDFSLYKARGRPGYVGGVRLPDGSNYVIEAKLIEAAGGIDKHFEGNLTQIPMAAGKSPPKAKEMPADALVEFNDELPSFV